MVGVGAKDEKVIVLRQKGRIKKAISLLFGSRREPKSKEIAFLKHKLPPPGIVPILADNTRVGEQAGLIAPSVQETRGWRHHHSYLVGMLEVN